MSDTGTDWAALADRLDDKVAAHTALARVVDGREGAAALRDTADDLRAAAVGLRRLAQLDTAIGDPEELRGWVDEYNGIMLRNFAAHILAAVLGSGEQPEGPTT